jgi:FkbM family methyltransferase
MSAIKALTKSCILAVWGKDPGPRRILRGIPAGYRLFVTPAENLSYLVGTAEPALQRAIRKYVSPGDTVYDIGAYIGYVSLSLAKRVGPSGQVFAFEPVPRNIEAVRRNIELNHLDNIKLLEFAASDQRGEATIRIADNSSMASMVWHQENASADKITIQTVEVDALIDDGQLGVPTFVKIDVEGAEGKVLTGMRRTVTKCKPVIFLECSDAGRETTWPLLCGFGYQCFVANSLQPVTSFEAYRHNDFLWLPPATPTQV